MPSSAEQVSTGGTHSFDPLKTSRIAPARSLAAALASCAAIAVGLVDRDDVDDLEDALLDALQLIAGAGEGEEGERVDHAGDRDLGLADADGLDQHDVEAGSLEDRHRLAGRAGDTAERAGARRGPDERIGVDRQPGHAGLVAEHRATRTYARRIDREHADAVALLDEVHAERLDERRLADAGHAGDADAHRSPSIRVQQPEQLARLGAMVAAARLDQRDGPRDRRPLARRVRPRRAGRRRPLRRRS